MDNVEVIVSKSRGMWYFENAKC